MGKRMKSIWMITAMTVMLSGCHKTQTAPTQERSEFLSVETSQEVDSEALEETDAVAAEQQEESEGEEEMSEEQTQDQKTVQGSDELVVLSFHDMYASTSSSRGLQFSETFSSMDGKTVQLSGYMVPPLKPVLHFFVLSKQPMSICPFCSTDADWPEDIVVVYVEKGAKSVANDTLLTVTGKLELGSYIDEETGFVSQARIYADEIKHNR